MDSSQELVGALTDRLERLEQEKDDLERAIEGQGDTLALKLRLALLAYEQQEPQRPHRKSKRSKSQSSTAVSSSPSSSLSTSASTSSSASVPASPSTQLSPVLPPPFEASPDVLSALRENETLRVRLANSERVNAYYQRELAELRRRCGISIDELEELDLSGNDGTAGPSVTSNQRRRPRSSSRSDWVNPSHATGSIRIPGASSVSPPSARRSSTSFPFSASLVNGTRIRSQSFISDASSVNTNLTTPSSSYPTARAPATTPATLNAFSPASRGSSSNALSERRNSLSRLVAAAFAQASPEALQEGDVTIGSSPTSAAGPASRGIDLDDLLHITSTVTSASHPPSASLTAALSSGTSSASSSSALSPTSASPADPLVAAITRSLARLAAAEPASNGQLLRRPYLDIEDEEDGDSGSSSTTSREGATGAQSVIQGTKGVGGEEDGGDTPLSVSPGSRSGSLSRRISTRMRVLPSG
ncbi:hypothetical protein JCM11641_000475 [Rhodosporidiobolus odoratus]